MTIWNVGQPIRAQLETQNTVMNTKRCLRLSIVCGESLIHELLVTPSLRRLRPRSHYCRNDGGGDGTVTFYRSHYTLRNVNVNVNVTLT